MTMVTALISLDFMSSTIQSGFQKGTRCKAYLCITLTATILTISCIEWIHWLSDGSIWDGWYSVR